MDFGLSRSTNPNGFLDTGYYRVIGTDWAYMSPQQWTGDPPHVSDDIYLLGAMYETVHGPRCPNNEGDVFKQLHEEIPPTPHRASG